MHARVTIRTVFRIMWDLPVKAVQAGMDATCREAAETAVPRLTGER
jgi:hypothetical protein